jgi:hypothetical protein
MRALALVLLSLLLAGCGGVAGEDLFADAPITPPGICPVSEDQGACDEQPIGPLHLAPAAAPYAAPAEAPPNPAADDAPDPDFVDVDGGVSLLLPPEVARG